MDPLQQPIIHIPNKSQKEKRPGEPQVLATFSMNYVKKIDFIAEGKHATCAKYWLTTGNILWRLTIKGFREKNTTVAILRKI